MAGECLSYGAFGAYNTIYSRPRGSCYSAPVNNRPRRRVDSWRNFLPDVASCKTPVHGEDADGRVVSPNNSPYDHEANAGIHDFNPEVTWVTKRYMPLDERTYAPVPRHKYILRPSGVPPPSHWIPPTPDSKPEVAKFTRLRDGKESFSSSTYTRDEKWSTLREMLPSNGRAIRIHPPDWGSQSSVVPLMTRDRQRRFPIVQSPMSRFVSDMHLTNREFKLF